MAKTAAAQNETMITNSPSQTVVRDAHGYFAKGTAPGPGRKPGTLSPEIKHILECGSSDAAIALVRALHATRPYVVRDGENVEVKYLPDFGMQVTAACAVLDRLYGRPAQSVLVSSQQEAPAFDLTYMSTAELKALHAFNEARDERLRDEADKPKKK